MSGSLEYRQSVVESVPSSNELIFFASFNLEGDLIFLFCSVFLISIFLDIF